MILLILTGGTIGSRVKNGTIDLGTSMLEQMYHSAYNDAEFEVIQPVNILSENIGLAEWAEIISAMNKVDTKKYEGIIIAHGSDTLAYTSALIRLLYNDIGLPVCLIAADRPLEDRRSNGLDNMHAAVVLIKNGLNGVWTIYADSRGQSRIKIHNAARMIEADTYNDKFSCYGGEPFGYIENDTLILNKNYPHLNFLSEKRPKAGTLDKKVLFIRPYPALDYSCFNIEDYAAVVHYSYHAGTACVNGQKNSLAVFADKCSKTGINIFFGSLKCPDGTMYASSAELIKGNIIPAFNISPYALYIKVLLACNQDMYDPKDLIGENIADEILPEK